MTEKLAEFSSRGDMKAITHKLIKGYENGVFQDKKVLFDTLESIACNFSVKVANGKRYLSATRNFYEALLTLGGPKIANFVAINLNGPALHSIYRWRKLQSVSLEPGIDKENFKQYAILAKGIMEVYNISPVPVLAAEDETAIVGVVQYHQDRDELLGFCGLKTDNPADHVCLQSCHIQVGNGPESYDNIINAFSDYKIGTYARVILLNPLHNKIPKLVALLMPTCNKFNHHHVYEQWQKIQNAYVEHLEPVLGPLIGHSSDGDSRRRKLQMQLMTCSAGERFRPISTELGFIFSARKEVNQGITTNYVIREIGDQDPIHNHKKIINHLDHASRMIYIGPELLVHMNHIERLLQRYPTFQHGLTRDHVKRDRDRQNWKVAQELSFKKVQNCLQLLINGDENSPPDPTVKGTKAFLELVYYYIELFFSPTASLTKRITYAGFVTHFLGIWRNFIYKHPQLTLSSNFLSRETYSDILISTHFCVMVICYYRDNFADQNCQLSLVGSECCEEFFPKNGQFVGNHHVYPYSQMFRNINHMIRLNQIEADDNAPTFAKAHIKQENIWDTQTPGGISCSLQDYPALGEEVNAWKEGMTMARQYARNLGIEPGFFSNENDGQGPDNPDDPDKGWFYRPFMDGDHWKLFKDLSSDAVGHSQDDDEGDDDGDDDDDDGGDDDDGPPGNVASTSIGNDSNHLFERTDDEALELQDILNSAVDNVEKNGEITESNRTKTTGSATVQVPDHGLQYISTLVKLLNDDPKLSKDRLVRVRQIQRDESNNQTVQNEGLSLFEDYAYLDKCTKSYQIGRLQRMRRNINKRTIEYKDTVRFSVDYLKDLTLSFAEYSKSDILNRNVLSLKLFKLIDVKANDVICHVNLTYNKSNDCFAVEEEEHNLIQQYVEKAFNKSKKDTSNKRRTTAEDTFDGRFSVVVVPEKPQDGRRVSGRVRKQINYIDY